MVGEGLHAGQHAAARRQRVRDERFLAAVDHDAGQRMLPEMGGDVVGSLELLDPGAGIEDETRGHVPQASPLAVACRPVELRDECPRPLRPAE